MKRKQTDRELLQEVEGIGPKRSEALVSKFGSGREVERAATSAFGRVAETDGISKDTAQDMFSRMNDAGVREDLQDRRRSNNEVRGVPQPTDIGREADGEYARPETAPDVTPAPVARDTRSGEFGVDPFDMSGGGGALDSPTQDADSVPSRPYDSRNDGPPSRVGPYELIRDSDSETGKQVAFQNEDADRTVYFQTYNDDLDGPEATVDVSFGDNIETVAEGPADEVYDSFIGELEERKQQNKKRDKGSGDGIQSRGSERLDAVNNLFGGDR